jgi:hypothetical protein
MMLRLKLWAAAFLAALAAALGLYAKGRADAKAKRDMRDAAGYRKTTERMQDADASIRDDPAALREWLRDRDPDQR